MDEMTDNSDPAPLSSPASPLAEPTDIELVARVRTGDEEAFEELFNRHRRRVSLIASRFFRQREQIEEVIQESFTKAYFALSDFSSQQESSFASWLARIAFNAAYDELRRIKRRGENVMSDFSEEEAASMVERVNAAKAGDNIESATVTRDLAG
ncbi:MAG TPA: sigma-70 family RNA polymerase sigma factor, partial [Pyrinomonadaceae bacterium]